MTQNNKKRVCAVIVTYNRKEYLGRLLTALMQQDYTLGGILIFDNYSSDGTDELLLLNGYTDSVNKGELHCITKQSTHIYYYKNVINSGGAGGFHDAIKMASKLDYDYLWIMDDDVLPDRDCLSELIKYQEDNCMITVPNRTGSGYQDYAITNVDLRKAFVKTPESWKTLVRPDKMEDDFVFVSDMAFEGPLINSKLTNEIGLPEKALFILFDDSEYAMRASKVTNLKFIKTAHLLKQIIPSANNKVAEWKLYYNFRNAVWFNKKYGETFRARTIRPYVLCRYWQLKLLFRKQKIARRLVGKAYRDGVKGKLGKVVDPANYKK